MSGQAVAALFMVAIVVLVGISVVGVVDNIFQAAVEDGDDALNGSTISEASYIIYQDGAYTCAQNGRTGVVDYRSTGSGEVINAVLQSCKGMGGTIVVRGGNYVIASGDELLFDANVSYVKLIGEGPSKTKLTYTGSGSLIDCTKANNWQLSDMTLVCNGAEGSGVAIDLHLAFSSLISRIFFEGSATGYFDYAVKFDKGAISGESGNNNLENCYITADIGVYDNARTNFVRGCTFVCRTYGVEIADGGNSYVQCTFGGAAATHGVYCNSSKASHAVFDKCWFENSKKEAINILAGHQFVFRDCWVHSYGTDHNSTVYIKNSYGSTFDGCNFASPAFPYDIYLYGCLGCNVVECTGPRTTFSVSLYQNNPATSGLIVSTPMSHMNGYATIPSGQSSVVITHHLAATPRIIIVTGTSNDTANLYVDSVNGTTFTIHSSETVASNRMVYWSAEV